MNKFNYGNQVCRQFDKLYNKREYSQFERYDNLIWQFKRKFHSDYCYIASSSGRVEIIGNHTDHNGGKVIGCAVNLDIVSAFKPNGSSIVRILSEGYSVIEFDIQKYPQLSGGVGLAEGVAAYLKNNGYVVGGVDIFTDSAVPSGAGVSSSAAYEMTVAAIINYCFNGGAIPVEVLAKAGQFAERKYLNKPCGLLDQGTVLTGGMALFDFKDGFDCSKIDGGAQSLRFILLNTGKSHAGLSHLYASIPKEMTAVAQFYGKERLIEVAPEQLYLDEKVIRSKLGDRPFLRAKHFFEENARVEQMTEALKTGNTSEIIGLINASGDSSMYQLQNCAVDTDDTVIADAIAYARSLGNVGARVHGGGFAGTVLCVTTAQQFNCVYSGLADRFGKDNVLPMAIRNCGVTVL